ncbi:MAG: hypothetical protein ACR2Q3_10985 [Woeseiaceae bacterium]
MSNFFQKKRVFLILAVSGMSLATGCNTDTDEPTVTEKALDELQSKYDELVEDKLESPVQWATDDLENIGDWEYKIIELPTAAAASLETTFNELGNDRWEVFWIEDVQDNYRVMLKRPSRSYLSRIPLTQIGRFVIDGTVDNQE